MSGDLQMNKIFGAALAVGLVVAGSTVVVKSLYEREKPEKPGYAIAVADTGTGGTEAAAVETLPDWGTILAKADLVAGEATFKKCTSCHNNAQGGPNMTGPNLYGVVGRPTGSHAGMAYSDGMMAHAKESPAWTYDALYAFLGNPQKTVPGTKMSFAGVKKSDERINLIAYLRSQGSTGYAIPAPDPSRAPGAAPAAGAALSAASPDAAKTDAAAKPAADKTPAAPAVKTGTAVKGASAASSVAPDGKG